MGSKSRRKWSSKEKLRIVMAGLDGGTEISELCRRVTIIYSVIAAAWLALLPDPVKQ